MPLDLLKCFSPHFQLWYDSFKANFSNGFCPIFQRLFCFFPLFYDLLMLALSNEMASLVIEISLDYPMMKLILVLRLQPNNGQQPNSHALL
jgi:hypothetical protein